MIAAKVAKDAATAGPKAGTALGNQGRGRRRQRRADRCHTPFCGVPDVVRTDNEGSASCRAEDTHGGSHATGATCAEAGPAAGTEADREGLRRP